MVKIVEEELWKSPGHPGMIVVTTCADIENDKLIMGAGAAYQAACRIPGIQEECAKAIYNACRKPYGFLVIREPRPDESKMGFGIFQTKDWHQKMAVVYNIETSVKYLTEYALANPEVNIRLNYPGIGYGALLRKEVEPLIANLPDNVTVCYKVRKHNFGIKDVYQNIVGYLQRGDRYSALQYLFRLGLSHDEANDQIEAVKKLLSEVSHASRGIEREQSSGEDNRVQQGRLL